MRGVHPRVLLRRQNARAVPSGDVLRHPIQPGGVHHGDVLPCGLGEHDPVPCWELVPYSRDQGNVPGGLPLRCWVCERHPVLAGLLLPGGIRRRGSMPRGQRVPYAIHPVPMPAGTLLRRGFDRCHGVRRERLVLRLRLQRPGPMPGGELLRQRLVAIPVPAGLLLCRWVHRPARVCAWMLLPAGIQRGDAVSCRSPLRQRVLAGIVSPGCGLPGGVRVPGTVCAGELLPAGIERSESVHGAVRVQHPVQPGALRVRVRLPGGHVAGGALSTRGGGMHQPSAPEPVHPRDLPQRFGADVLLYGLVHREDRHVRPKGRLHRHRVPVRRRVPRV